MNLPRDKNSNCSDCHRDMYLASEAFRHDWHASPLGANLACLECHAGGASRTRESAVACTQCHRDLVPEGAVIEVKQYKALGYADAMHQLCIGCHTNTAREKDMPDLARCANCHKEVRSFVDSRNLVFREDRSVSKSVVLPESEK